MIQHLKSMTFWNVFGPVLAVNAGEKTWQSLRNDPMFLPCLLLPVSPLAASTVDIGSSRADSTWMGRSWHNRCLSPS